MVEMRILDEVEPPSRGESMRAPAVVLAVVSAALYLGAFLLASLW
jgi:hypothetical protein